MQRLEVSGAVRPIYGSLGVKRLKVKFTPEQPFLTWGPRTPWGSTDTFWGGVRKLGWKKQYYFIVTNLYMKYSFHPIMNVRSNVICVLCTPKMFVNFNKSHYLYAIRLNAFFSEGVCSFHQTLKGVHGIKKSLRTSALEQAMNAQWGGLYVTAQLFL